MRINVYKVFMILVFFIQSGRLEAQMQSTNSSVINSAGGFGNINGQMFDFNLGEMVLVETFNVAPHFLLSQGFLQPYLIFISTVTDVTLSNNVLTPNNDGKNDFLVVKGLQNYPGSVLNIYDRAGRSIYCAVDYKNNFDGQIDGKLLNEDTYYYVIELGNSRGKLKGFITIIKDE